MIKMPIYNTKLKKDGLTKYIVRINYADSSGTHRQLTRVAYGLQTAKDMELMLTNSLTERTTGSNITVRELCDEYLRIKKHEVRDATLRKNIQILQHHVLPSLGATRIGKLNTRNLTGWKLEMENKDLANITKKNAYAVLRAMLNYGVKMDYLARNPLSKVGNFRDPYATKKTILHYTPDEYKKYAASALKYADQSDFYDFYVFFSLAYYTGARKGEIHALKWTDIEGNVLHITRSISQKFKAPDIETPPKNKSSVRSIQLPTPLVKILDDHYYRVSKTYTGFEDSYRICGGLRSLRDASVARANVRYAADAGLHRIRIHDFRHSHASLLANAGVNILEIARRLGHADVEQTLNTYSHFYPQEEEKALRILDNI